MGVKREAGSGALGFCSQNLFSGSDGDSLSQTSGGLAQGMTVAGLIPSLQDALTCTDWAGNERISLTHLPGACCQSPGWTKSIAASLLLRLQKLRGPPRGGGRTPALPPEHCPAPFYPLLLTRSFHNWPISHPTTFTVPVPPSTLHPHPGPCSTQPGAARGIWSRGLQGSAGQGNAVGCWEMQWGARKCSGVLGRAH